ncbi:MAG: helix-turn-helix domain-containing protein [Calothrix sp. FI2-JRJ7]|jgi:transcriptional regulator with XRE-family HTH domain|nr:helix-turn-helix domain-containing protein [Calothrix sp. FI2-JRJ7]
MDKDAKARFVEKLMQAQAERSQRRFAKDLEVQLGTLQNWLRGDSYPTPENFKKIAAAAGMSQLELFAYIFDEDTSNLPPAPIQAEQALSYLAPLSKKEKVRLIKLLLDDVADD